MTIDARSSRTSRRIDGGDAGSARQSWSGESKVKLCMVGRRKLALMFSVPFVFMFLFAFAFAFASVTGPYPPLSRISDTDTPANFLIIVKSIIRSGAA